MVGIQDYKEGHIVSGFPSNDVARALGLLLFSEKVYFSKRVLKKIRQKHKAAYPILKEYLEEIICSPDYVGQGESYQHHFEVIKEIGSIHILVAVSSEVNKQQNMEAKSTYIIPKDTVNRRLRKGTIKRMAA